MASWTGRAAALAAMLLATPLGAVPLHYTSLHALGDSLSDKGNAYSATLGRIPKSPPYWKGRFSNGPVWAEHLADAFKAVKRPTANHAWGGAQARTDSDGIPDLALQAKIYRQTGSKQRGARPLLTLWAGANDVLNAVRGNKVEQVGRRAAAAVGATAAWLHARGVRDFLILNLPDLGRIPRHALHKDPARARAATAGTLAYNTRLDREIAELRAAGATVHKLDIHALFAEMIADPLRFGLRDTTTPCLDAKDRPCSAQLALERAFYDDIHPNSVVHQRIAEAALAALSGPSAATTRLLMAGGLSAPSTLAVASAAPLAQVPLPLPAPLLAGGVLVLALAARRHRQRASSGDDPDADGTSDPKRLASFPA